MIILKDHFKMIIKNLKAAYLEKINRPLKLIEGPAKFNLKEHQLLIKIYYSGVCRSQIMEQEGQRGNQKYLPHFLGHEGSGVIVAKGNKVKKFKIGEEVIITWIKCHGNEDQGSVLKINNKIINYGPVTTFSNYSIISENRLVKKPKEMSFEEAALFGCALSTGCGMVMNLKNINKNDKIIVLGCGGIGFSVLLMIKSMALSRNLYVLDKDIKKLKKLKFFFKDVKIFNSEKNLKNYLLRRFNSLADICFESAGSAKTIESGFNLINSTGALIFASHPKKNEKIKLDPHQLISGKTIKGSWGGDCNPDKDIKKIYTIIKKGLKNVLNMYCRVYKINNINDAIRDIKQNKIFRPLINMKHEF